MLHAHGTHRKGTNPLRAASEFDHPSAWPFGLWACHKLHQSRMHQLREV